MNQRRNFFFEQSKNRLVPEEDGGNEKQTAHEHIPLHGFHDKAPQHMKPPPMEQLYRHGPNIGIILTDRLGTQIGQTAGNLKNTNGSKSAIFTDDRIARMGAKKSRH